MYILQYRGLSLASQAIKIWTWGEYSHSALGHSDGSICEAWEKAGVDHVSDPWVNHVPGTPVDVYRLKRSTPFQNNMIWSAALSKRGCSYDWKALLGFMPATRWLWKDDPNLWFCSHYVPWACRAGGVYLFSVTTPLYKISPSKISWSPELAFVGQVVNNYQYEGILKRYAYTN